MSAVQHTYRGLTIAVLLFWSAAAFALSEVKPDPAEAALLKLANEKICDPESEMYCQAHTVFVFKNDAVVLLSVQPTAGLFVVFQKKAEQWIAKNIHQLLAYKEVLDDSVTTPDPQLSKAAQAYFKQAITVYLESKIKSK